jgi:Ca2+-binding RTX toxin-like protein
MTLWYGRSADTLFAFVGAAVGSPFQVNIAVAGRQIEPRITGLAEGRFVVGFTNQPPGDAFAIHGRVFDPREAAIRLNGTLGSDGPFGTIFADDTSGFIGDDRLVGGVGDDLLLGESGNDALGGGPGQDRLHGGDGRDALNDGDGSVGLAGGEAMAC